LSDPANAAISDIVIAQMVPFSVVGGNIVLALAIGPHDTRVFQVSGGVAYPTPTPTNTSTPALAPTPTATATPSITLSPTPSVSPSPLYLPLVLTGLHELMKEPVGNDASQHDDLTRQPLQDAVEAVFGLVEWHGLQT
jgi:hypothetical protein